MYLHAVNEVAILRHSKLNRRWHVHCKWWKYENSSQGQKSRSYVTNFQPLLAFTVGHIFTKLHRFLISSFRDFLQTDRRTNRQTDRCCQKRYLLPACMQVITCPTLLDSGIWLKLEPATSRWRIWCFTEWTSTPPTLCSAMSVLCLLL